jgi:hypothetical protein
MMKIRLIKNNLSDLKELMVDRLYRFSDNFFDDSAEKTDFADTRYIEYIVRNSGIVYMTVKKKSSEWILILSELFELLFINAGLRQKAPGIIKSIFRPRMKNPTDDFYYFRLNWNTEPIEKEVFPLNNSIPARLLAIIAMKVIPFLAPG